MEAEMSRSFTAKQILSRYLKIINLLQASSHTQLDHVTVPDNRPGGQTGKGRAPVHLRGVGHEAGTVEPVHEEFRRLQYEAGGCVLPQVQRDLMADGGRDLADRATKLGLNGPVDVAAEDAFYLRVARDGAFQILRSRKKPCLIHMADAGIERRVMQHHERGRGQRSFKKVDCFGCQFAVAGARNKAVEADDADGTAGCDEVEMSGLRQITGLSERLAKRRSAVVIAGHGIDRHRKTGEQLPDDVIFCVKTAIRQISRDQHTVRTRNAFSSPEPFNPGFPPN